MYLYIYKLNSVNVYHSQCISSHSWTIDFFLTGKSVSLFMGLTHCVLEDVAVIFDFTMTLVTDIVSINIPHLDATGPHWW